MTLDIDGKSGGLSVPGVDMKDLRPSTPRGTGSDDPYGFGQLTASNKGKQSAEEAEEPIGLEASKAALLESAATLEPLLKPVTASASTGGKKKASFLDKLKKSAKPQDEATGVEVQSPGIKPFVAEQVQSPDQKIQLVVTPADGDATAAAPQVNSLNASPAIQKVGSPSPFKTTTGTKKKKAKIVIEVDMQEEIDALRQELEVLESQFAEETDEARQSELEEEILKINIEIDNKMQEAALKAEQALKAAEEAANPATSEFDTELDLAEQEQALLAAETEQTTDTNSSPNEAPKKKGGKPPT